MLECKEFDAVLIATPDKFHAQAVVAAARAGKDILCEKPLALNLADAHTALAAVIKTWFSGCRSVSCGDTTRRMRPR